MFQGKPGLTLTSLAMIGAAIREASRARNDFDEPDFQAQISDLNHQLHNPVDASLHVQIELNSVRDYELVEHRDMFVMSLGTPERIYVKLYVNASLVGASKGVPISDVVEALNRGIYNCTLIPDGSQLLMYLHPSTVGHAGAIYIGYYSSPEGFTTTAGINALCLSSSHQSSIFEERCNGFTVSFVMHSEDRHGIIQYIGLQPDGPVNLTSFGQMTGHFFGAHAYHCWAPWDEKAFRTLMKKWGIPERDFLPVLAVFRTYGGLVTVDDESINAALRDLGLRENERAKALKAFELFAPHILVRLQLGHAIYFMPKGQLIREYSELL